MKSRFTTFKLSVFILFLTFIVQTAQSQEYYTPPGRSEALLIGPSDIGRDFYTPIHVGAILGSYVYTDARDISEYNNFFHYKARGVCYMFTLKYASTVIIDQVGSQESNNMSFNLFYSPYNELNNDWDLNLASLPQEYLSHPFVLASVAQYWYVIYKQELQPGTYYIASNGGYGNAGAYGGIVVTNIHIISQVEEGGFESPYYVGSFDNGFKFSDRKDISNKQSVYGKDTPDVVYALDMIKAGKLTVTTNGSQSPGSKIYILDENQIPVEKQNIIIAPEGFITVTINKLLPGTYYVVSEAGEYYGELQTVIEGYMTPDPSDENGPMPGYSPNKEILPEPENNNPIRYRYDATGNRADRRIFWP